MNFNPLYPFTWATKESVSTSDLSQEVSHRNKKRKKNENDLGDADNDVTLESIAAEIKDLKESNLRIENLLKCLVEQNKKQVSSIKFEEQPVVQEEQEEKSTDEGEDNEEETTNEDNDEKEEDSNQDENDDEEEVTSKEDEKEDEESTKEDNEEGTSNSEEEKDPDPEELLAFQWVKRFGELSDYKKEHGDCNIPSSNLENATLRRWVQRQRYEKRTGTLSMAKIKIAKLNSIGFDWSPPPKTPTNKNSTKKTPTKKTPSKKGRSSARLRK